MTTTPQPEAVSTGATAEDRLPSEAAQQRTIWQRYRSSWWAVPLTLFVMHQLIWRWTPHFEFPGIYILVTLVLYRPDVELIGDKLRKFLSLRVNVGAVGSQR